jgi:uncharacterized protein YqeY
MSLKEEIRVDLKEAMREKNEIKKSTLRMILAAIETEEKVKGKDLDDPSVQFILKREMKKREESHEAFSNAGHKDRADIELLESVFIQKYLPQVLTLAELDLAVDTAIVAVSAQSMKDMGKVMKFLNDSYGAALDGKAASALVKETLQNIMLDIT